MVVYVVVKKVTTEKRSLIVHIDTVYTEMERAKRRCDEINEENRGNVFATWVTAYLIDKNYGGEDYIHD